MEFKFGLLGLLVGFAIGLNVGGIIVRKLMQPLIDDYKKSVEYWFQSYMDSRKRNSEFAKEILKILK